MKKQEKKDIQELVTALEEISEIEDHINDMMNHAEYKRKCAQELKEKLGLK
jgi:hypothetical protein